MIYFLAIINITFISIYFYRCRAEFVEWVKITKSRINSKIVFYFGNFLLIDKTTYPDYLFGTSGLYTTTFNPTYSMSVNGTISVANGGFGVSTAAASLSGNNLIFSNNVNQITLDEIIGIKDSLNRLKQDYYETKYKHAQRIHNIETQNEE